MAEFMRAVRIDLNDNEMPAAITVIASPGVADYVIGHAPDDIIAVPEQGARRMLLPVTVAAAVVTSAGKLCGNDDDHVVSYPAYECLDPIFNMFYEYGVNDPAVNA